MKNLSPPIGSRVDSLKVTALSADGIERAMDRVLADSFPASDPPSWTPAVVETRPGARTTSEPLLVTSSGQPAWLQAVSSTARLIAVVWTIPLFVVALPLALVWRAVLATTTWRTV